MKKLLFMLLCCGIFVIGCNNNDEIFEVEEYDVAESGDVNNDTNAIDDNQKNRLEAEAEKELVGEKEGGDLDKANEFANQAKKEMEAGNFSKAVDLYNEAISVCKNDWLYGDRGRAKYQAKDLEGAVKDLTKAIFYKKRSIYYLWRSEAYFGLGNIEFANRDVDESKALPQD